jgi:formate hydrogenlyase subunit 3/multisubunit Na+/H+ antiporter MnhD subunit
VAAPSQRRALGVLFLLLALAFAGIAFAAGTAEKWIIVGASAAIALWLAGLAVRGLKP